MITVEEARQRVLSLPLNYQKETIDLSEACGRFIYKDIISPIDLPLWSQSAMDGYALKHADILDTPTTLSIVDTIPAGHRPTKVIKGGECARIMTGAPLPSGADSIVIQENTGRDGLVLTILKGTQKGSNIRWQGEELKKNDFLYPAGTQLSVGHMSVLASLGIHKVSVWKKPKIAVFATGDELCQPPSELQVGEIFGSNTLSLMSAIQKVGGRAIDCGIARDNSDSTAAAIDRALSHKPDIILSTGGVSVGDFDVVRDEIAKYGADIHFEKVRMKPGKPVSLSTLRGVPYFGLPGNPVSAMVGFYQLIWPLIRNRFGAEPYELPSITACAGQDIKKSHKRAEFYRVRLINDPKGLPKLFLTGSQSSAWSTSLAQADALFYVPWTSEGVKKGDIVTCQKLP